MVGQIVTRVAATAEKNADKIFEALDGLGGQETADALVLAIVRHIETTIPAQHRAEVAHGLAGAILQNLEG